MTVKIELPDLSQRAAAYLARHPRAAREAVASALEAAARRREFDEVPEQLRDYVDEAEDDTGLLGPSEAARRLHISRQTVYAWVSKGKLLGWRTHKRGLKVPGEQILGPERIVPGLDEVVGVLGDHEFAWVFLDEEQTFEDGIARPIDMLKHGHVPQVLGAAEAFGSATT